MCFAHTTHSEVQSAGANLCCCYGELALCYNSISLCALLQIGAVEHVKILVISSTNAEVLANITNVSSSCIKWLFKNAIEAIVSFLEKSEVGFLLHYLSILVCKFENK
jgi:hypothetical protein